MELTKIKLNPCSKCGGEGEICESYSYGTLRFFKIKCKRCKHEVNSELCGTSSVIDSWNAEEPCYEENSDPENKLFDVYMTVEFRKHFCVWALSEEDAESKITEQIDAGDIPFTGDDIKPGTLDFRHWGPTEPDVGNVKDILNWKDSPEFVD